MNLACTSLWQIEGFWPFSRYVESITYAVSIAFLVRSPPPVPNHQCFDRFPALQFPKVLIGTTWFEKY